MANKFTSKIGPRQNFTDKIQKNPNVTRDPQAGQSDLKQWNGNQDTIKKDQEQERFKASQAREQAQEPAKGSKLKDAVNKVTGYFRKSEPAPDKSKTPTPDR